MSTSTPTPAAHAAEVTSRRERLVRFLEAYWLRPENAFWMTIRSELLSRARRAHPGLDLCCGDGVFSFLHGGGRLDPSWDVFQSVAGLDRVRREHHDIFDHVDEHFEPPILEPSQERFDVGCDAKAALLRRAAKLGNYDRLVEHDANEPLPFADGEFRHIYCNAIYWVRRIDALLAELRRVTAVQGRITLQVKLTSLRDYTLEVHRERLGDELLDILGRGRAACWPSLADRATWESRFRRVGFEILSAEPFISRTQAHIWDVGLRPIAPLLIRMANALSRESRAAIKRDWVNLLTDMLLPFCEPCLDLIGGASEPAEMQYQLVRAT